MDFSFLTPEHCQPWAELLATSFERTPLEMQLLLDWLQAGYRLIAFGAWDGSQLVAQYSCRLTPLHIPHRPEAAKVGMSINMAVHPDYRGRGLIKQLAPPVYEQVAALGGLAGVGFSNAQGVKVDQRSKSYGYQVVGKLDSTLIWIRHGLQSTPISLSENWPQVPFSPQAESQTHIHFDHTPQTLYHRFACHPFRQYQFGVWQEGDCVRGIVVYRLVRKNGVSGAALFAVYGDDLPQLLSGWARALCASGIRFIHVVTSQHSTLRPILPSIGPAVTLPYTRSPHYLTAKALKDTPAMLFDYPQWDCIGGDIL